MPTPCQTAAARIKKLPPLLINQLAAGEIVTRPASVVKELLENAIDAGATNIEIKVTQGGMGMIEVSDNGCGIHPDDMVMAVTRHATSKIADVANLQGIRTLGFRGEALASTAAVSRLTLSSSHDNSGIGRQLNVAGILEDTPILAPIVHNQGTTVLVKDLYFNVPARRGNLKSIATEFAHIESVVREVALVYADVNLTLYHDQKKRLVLPANSASTEMNDSDSLAGFNDNLEKGARLSLSRLEQALGSSIDAQVIPLYVDLEGLLGANFDAIDSDNLAKSDVEALDLGETDNFNNLPDQANTKDNYSDNSPLAGGHPSTIDSRSQLEGQVEEQEDMGQITAHITPHIEGWLWLLPKHSRDANALNPSLDNPPPQSLPKLIYVNGRLIKEPLIAGQIRQALQSVGMANSGYALYFQLPTPWLNLNVHPSKQRIKIHPLANIMAYLNYAIKTKLGVFATQSQLENNQISQPTKNISQLDSSYALANSHYNTTFNKATLLTGQVTEPSGVYELANQPLSPVNKTIKSADLSNSLFNNLSNNVSHNSDLAGVNYQDNASLLKISNSNDLTPQKSISDIENKTQHWPQLLNVINSNELTSHKNFQNTAGFDNASPLLLIFGRHQHFLIEHKTFIHLLACQKDDAADIDVNALLASPLSAETFTQDKLINNFVRQYSALMQSYVSGGGNVDTLYSLLNQHSLAVLNLDQLLKMMLTQTKG